MFARVEYFHKTRVIPCGGGGEYLQKVQETFSQYVLEDQCRGLNWCTSFLEVASILGKNSHCVSHGVAALIVKDGRIISTGINGTPAGLKNCDQVFPKDGFDKAEHHCFSLKYEIHAEINAFLSAARHGISTEGASIYVNYSPCRDCAKAILAAGIKAIYFKELYRNDLSGLELLHFSDMIRVIQIVEGKDEEDIKNIATRDEKDFRDYLKKSTGRKDPYNF